MNKLFIILSLFFSLSLTSQKVNWLSIEKAQELQKKVPKNIIMDIYTDWCGPCKLMDKNTFQNPDVAQYLNNNFYMEGYMNICIRSTFKCSFEVFKAKVMEDKSQWSKFVDDYQIAKVDEHNSIMVMNVLDFEAMEAFMTTD